jgi:hypothetical protein
MHRYVALISSAMLVAAASLRAQSLDEAAFKGRVFLTERGSEFDLRVRFAPDDWRGKPDSDRRISAIGLRLAGHSVTIPSRAFADLRDVVRVWPVFAEPFHAGRVRIQFDGGDGEKSYRCDFVLDRHRLLYREFTPHLQKPQITRY